MRGSSLHGLPLLLHATLVLALPLASAQPNGSYTADNTYQANLRQLADELRRNVSSNLFVVGAVGVGSVPDAPPAVTPTPSPAPTPGSDDP
uniref:Uncharacterized protein n=1 Tax=Oryza brachyantha TaxID=4533 RepID=J3MEC7_ORYBR